MVSMHTSKTGCPALPSRFRSAWYGSGVAHGIRTARADDLARCAELSQQAGWNQGEADWRRLYELNPRGCFVLEDRGRIVGSTVTTRFESVTWVSMVLVDQACRGRGFGGLLVRHAVDDAAGAGATSIRLDATPLGRPLYEKLGFEPDYELVRYVGQPSTAAATEAEEPARPVTAAAEVFALDRSVTATSRAALLERLCDPADDRALVIADDAGVRGYIAWRPGRTAWQIGPAVATDAVAGQSLLSAAARRLPHQRWIVDIPAANRAATAWAIEAGLVEERRLLRMTLGGKLAERPQDLWASSGPEKG